jgi:hypothetical protein
MGDDVETCSRFKRLLIEIEHSGELLDGEAEAIARKAIELAKKGDLAAIRLCLDRRFSVCVVAFRLHPRRSESLQLGFA